MQFTLLLSIFSLALFTSAAPQLRPEPPSPTTLTFHPASTSIPLSTSTAAASPEPLAIFTVRDFVAFVADNGTASTANYVKFYFIDPRPDFTLALNCLLNGTIYKPLFSSCEGRGAKFRLNDGQLEIKRDWHVVEDRAWIIGFAPQGTYWKEGEGGNVTKVEGGKLYTRTAEWQFPIKSAIASWDP
ncbi:hypothetical protein BU24DRAFT_416069 [Aaosphaeria arxii CBS 175.79]|uniref:AA1-like domain-containing protein n=1 Tax=Aaosphaeria arxii CBS 175.79 TaxID=1450172 RepID=A0A6A5Y482_9PLEO|nr:uncharacterized protein BU24DRAFT_416069 [Aaosphaeria arxii CBS 175.79]KAF2020362.1 hypothetical protein BU24DRAFT_416069 [Aaosphaeria arxii CBS 175.79]